MDSASRNRVFLLFTAAYFISYFYRSANAVIAPSLAADLSLSAADLGLMTSLFFASFAAVQLPLGAALDRWGARVVTPGLMLIGAGGSLVFALAPSFLVLAVGRALIGVGMAGVLMGALKAFSRWFAEERFATATGLLVGIGSAGALMAATPLAWLTATFGWRLVFVASTLVTVGVAAAILAGVRNGPRIRTSTEGTATRGNLATIFTSRAFWRLAPHTFFMTGSLISFQTLWAGPYLYDTYGLQEVETGNVLFVLSLSATAGFAACGWLADRFGLWRMMVASSVVFVLVQFFLAATPSLAFVWVGYAVFGLSGAFNILILAQAGQLFPAGMTGQAVTAVNLFGIGGAFLLQWGTGLIVDAFVADVPASTPPAAYTAALLCTGAGNLMSLLWYAPVRKAQRQGHPG